jgi:molybdopterin-binding protein
VTLVVEITSSARTELALEAGAPVCVSFNATEVTVQPD